MHAFFIAWALALATAIVLLWTVETINERARNREAKRPVGEAERGVGHEVHNG